MNSTLSGAHAHAHNLLEREAAARCALLSCDHSMLLLLMMCRLGLTLGCGGSVVIGGFLGGALRCGVVLCGAR